MCLVCLFTDLNDQIALAIHESGYLTKNFVGITMDGPNKHACFWVVVEQLPNKRHILGSRTEAKLLLDGFEK